MSVRLFVSRVRVKTFCVNFNSPKNVKWNDTGEQNKLSEIFLLIKHETHVIGAKTHTELNENKILTDDCRKLLIFGTDVGYLWNIVRYTWCIQEWVVSMKVHTCN